MNFIHIKAFTPFYDEAVKIGRHTVKACVLDAGYDEIIDDESATASKIRKIAVRFPATAAEFTANGALKPKVGDILTLANGVAFAVTTVEVDEGAFVLEARQK